MHRITIQGCTGVETSQLLMCWLHCVDVRILNLNNSYCDVLRCTLTWNESVLSKIYLHLLLCICLCNARCKKKEKKNSEIGLNMQSVQKNLRDLMEK